MLSIFFKSIIIISAFGIGTANQLRKIQKTHTPQRLTNSDLKHLAALTNAKHLNQAIDNILIPRVVGTKNHEKVFKYITSELESLGWDVEVDEFQDNAPNFGRLTFKNIVGSLNPDADRFLVLACHYDSKYFANEVFVGATDSAVPCAMLLNLAKVLKPYLDSVKSNDDLSLKLLFLDGEEAFEQWGPKDSIYGARHLAAKYHKKRTLTKSTREQVSDLQKIDLFVLLDLIGHRDVHFYNYFAETSGWFLRLADAEDRLDKFRLLNPRDSKYFIRRDFFTGNIEDDHLPFLRKNVPILHLIPLPFPREWHTPNDNKDIIDIATVENLNMILRIFLAEYLHMLDILVNNAGMGTPENKKTEDGLLILMQSNYFGPFLLTNLLLDLLKKTKNSRIVNVSSLAAKQAKNFDVKTINEYPEKGDRLAGVLYSNSKLCNILFTIELAQRLKGTSVTTYSLHPGVILTEFLRDMSPSKMMIIEPILKCFFKSPIEGAQTQIYCSVAKGIESESGEHFADCAFVTRYKSAQDPDLPKKLWKVSEQLTKLNSK